MKRDKSTINMVLIFLVMVIGSISYFWHDPYVSTKKDITVEIVASRFGLYYRWEDITEEVSLEKYLIEKVDIEYQVGERGAFVYRVDGIKANPNNREWWEVYVNNDRAGMAVDRIEIKDEDYYLIEFKRGW